MIEKTLRVALCFFVLLSPGCQAIADAVLERTAKVQTSELSKALEAQRLELAKTRERMVASNATAEEISKALAAQRAAFQQELDIMKAKHEAQDRQVVATVNKGRELGFSATEVGFGVTGLGAIGGGILAIARSFIKSATRRAKEEIHRERNEKYIAAQAPTIPNPVTPRA